MPSFSLRNPHTIIVGALIITILGFNAFARMPVDVFPPLHIPAVVVATFYPGMPPQEMERDITTRFERFFTMGSEIEHIESRSLPGVSIIKVFFHPGINLGAAAAGLGDLAMADLRHLPPGTLPPLVLPSGASSLPVVLVTVSGKGFTQAQLRDQAQYNIRNFLATVEGASVPPPFGGKYRQIMVYLDRDALQARGLTPMDVVHALNRANLIIPAGDAKIGTQDYFVYTNSMIDDPADINDVPVKIGQGQEPVYVRDIGHAEDAAADPAEHRAHRRSALGLHPGAEAERREHHRHRQRRRAGAAENHRDAQGDEAATRFSASPLTFAMRSTRSSTRRSSGAVLASLMILIFLGSFRSTFAIFLSIPLSILAGAFGLMMGGSTINIMTLGGFALAIGRLVDDSTVVLENINRHLAEGKAPKEAARDGAEEVALPVLASTITTIIVFFPVMFLFGVAKYLFSALALAVVLSMVASYLVAMSVIPIYCARFSDRGVGA